MFKLTYGKIKDREFEAALQKLGSTFHEDAKVNYGVAKIIRRYYRESKKAQEIWGQLITDNAETTETGKIKPPEGRPFGFTIRKDKEAGWPDLVASFDQTEIEIDCHKLKPSEIVSAKLSPNELNSLEDILTEDSADQAPQ